MQNDTLSEVIFMEMCHTRSSAYNTNWKLLAYKHPLDSFLPLEKCFSQASAVNIESQSECLSTATCYF